MKLEGEEYVRKNISGIEMYIFGANENEGAPIIFNTHGRGGYVEGTFGFSKRLAREGFVSICVEQRNHGKRLVDARANGGGPLHGIDMYATILGTAQDISLIIDFISAKFGINTDKIGMTGGSLGGHVTLMAMTLDERIMAGVPFISSGDYETLMKYRFDNDENLTDKRAFYPLALHNLVLKNDPIHNAKKFKDRPLLMLNGHADDLVQIECNENFYAKAKEHYSDKDLIELIAYEGVKHQVTEEMQEECVRFFKTHLV